MSISKLSRYRSVEIQEGKHYPDLFDFSWTLRLSYRPINVVKFTKKSKYYMFGDVDQSDWNKLYGRLGYTLRSGKLIRLEEFWVWRYYLGQFQIAKYRRTGRVFGAFEIQNVSIDQDVFLSNDWFTLPLPLGTYFGGADSDNDGIGGVAPQNINIYFIK